MSLHRQQRAFQCSSAAQAGTYKAVAHSAMGCGLSAATDHAVAVASRRVEKDQVVEKAVHKALQAAVAELQDVEISLHVQTPTSRIRGRGLEDVSSSRTPLEGLSPVSPLRLGCS